MVALDVSVAHEKWRVGGKAMKAHGSQVICEVTEMGKKKKKKESIQRGKEREMLLAEAFQMAVSKANLYL